MPGPCQCFPSSFMKLLLSGSDREKLERLRKRLIGMGVACDLVHDCAGGQGPEVPTYPELWVRKDEDFETATLMLTRAGAVGQVWRG